MNELLAYIELFMANYRMGYACLDGFSVIVTLDAVFAFTKTMT